ncbi:unnamed protein product, partial [Scytosiphon promiscuus]
GGLEACILSIIGMPVSLSEPAAQTAAIETVAQRVGHLVGHSKGNLSVLQVVESALRVPAARPEFVRFFWGDTKKFLDADLLADCVEHGVPIRVAAGSNIAEAFAYGNHRSADRYASTVLSKIYDDVRLGRAFVLPRASASLIPGLRISPLGAVVSPDKVRIIHDLSFDFSGRSPSVNSDTDFASAPPVELGD